MKHLYCSLADRHRWPARGFPHRCGGAGGDFIINIWMWSGVGRVRDRRGGDQRVKCRERLKRYTSEKCKRQERHRNTKSENFGYTKYKDIWKEEIWGDGMSELKKKDRRDRWKLKRNLAIERQMQKRKYKVWKPRAVKYEREWLKHNSSLFSQ